MSRYSHCGRKPNENWTCLKIVTCNISENDLKFIELFVKECIAPSRSAYVRNAVRNQINRDIKTFKTYKGIINEVIKLDPEKFVMIPGYNGNKPIEILRRLE